MKEKIEAWKAEKDILYISVIVGILAHGYMLTNKLPNIDDYVAMFHYGQGYASGRWLLGLMGNFMFRIDGTYSLPFFNGILYILTLALAVTIFLKPMPFKNRWTKRILAALFVAFPTATATMGFMFTAPFYGLAVLFMAVAFYMLVNYKHGYLLSIILICMSLGIYQAYWGLAAGFLLLYLITLCLSDEDDNAKLISLSLKSFIALLCGVVLYLIVNKIMLKVQGVTLDTYQGLNQMGQFDISLFPDILKNAYGYFVKFTSENYLHITWYPIVRIVIAIGYVVTAILSVIAIIRQKNILKRIALPVFIILFPLAVNSIYIMSQDTTSVHTLMCYSVVLVFFIPFILLNGILGLITKKQVIQITKCCYAIAVALVCFIYVRFANIYYFNLELAYNQTYSFMQTLSTRIQDSDGYTSDKQILFYGLYSQTPNQNIWHLRMVNNMTGSVDVPYVINSSLMRQNFSKFYLGAPFNEVPDRSIIEQYERTIDNMPVYPDDGSIQVVDNIVIVKFAEEYIWK